MSQIGLKKYTLLFAHLCKSFPSDLNTNGHLSKHLEAPNFVIDVHILKVKSVLDIEDSKESSSYTHNHISFPSSSNCLLAIHFIVETDLTRALNSICALADEMFIFCNG